jgi:hypothetical protein
MKTTIGSCSELATVDSTPNATPAVAGAIARASKVFFIFCSSELFGLTALCRRSAASIEQKGFRLATSQNSCSTQGGQSLI